MILATVLADVLADVAIAPFILAGGFILGLPILLAVTLIEGFVAWRMKWSTFRQSLRDMFIANLVTTLVGLLLDVIFTTTIYSCGYVPINDGKNVIRSCNWIISPLLLFVILWAISVAIEGFILQRFNRQPNRRTWIITLVANTLSYILLLPLYALLLTS